MGSPVDEEHDQHRDFGKCWLSTEKKKKAKYEHCELFYLGKMRTIVWEKAFQTFLKKCSKKW